MRYAIQDKDGHLFYDGPPPKGKPLTFDTEEEAKAYVESGNWQLDGAKIVPAPSRKSSKGSRS